MADAGRSMGIFVSLVKPKRSGLATARALGRERHRRSRECGDQIHLGDRARRRRSRDRETAPGDGDTRGGLVLRAGDVRDGGLVKVRVVVRRRIRRTGHTSGHHLDVGGSTSSRCGVVRSISVLLAC